MVKYTKLTEMIFSSYWIFSETVNGNSDTLCSLGVSYTFFKHVYFWKLIVPKLQDCCCQNVFFIKTLSTVCKLHDKTKALLSFNYNIFTLIWYIGIKMEILMIRMIICANLSKAKPKKHLHTQTKTKQNKHKQTKNTHKNKNKKQTNKKQNKKNNKKKNKKKQNKNEKKNKHTNKQTNKQKKLGL